MFIAADGRMNRNRRIKTIPVLRSSIHNEASQSKICAQGGGNPTSSLAFCQPLD